MEKINIPEPNSPDSFEGVEKKIEKLPTSWREYFLEPYSKVVQEWIEKKNNIEIDITLDSFVRHINNFGLDENLACLYDSFHEIEKLQNKEDKPGYYFDLGLERTSDYIKAICYCYLPQYRNEVDEIPNKHNPEIDQKVFVAHLIESLFDSVNLIKKGFEPDIFEHPTGYVTFTYFNSVYKVLSEIERDNPEIIYVAPRSAMFSTSVIKEAIHVGSKNNQMKHEPYFAYPKSKSFKITRTNGSDRVYSPYSESSLDRTAQINGLFVSYLISMSQEDKKNLIDSYLLYYKDDIKDVENYTSELVERVELLTDDLMDLIKVVEGKIDAGDEVITIKVYDETLETGSTTRAMVATVDIVKKYIERKYSREVLKTSTLSPIDKTGGYDNLPKYLKGKRYGSDKIGRYSILEDKEAHHFAKVIFDTAHALGNHFAFLYDSINRLKNNS